MAKSGKRVQSEFDHVVSLADWDAPRGLWLTTGKEWVYGVLAGLGVLEHFQVIGDSHDERLPILIRLKKNPQRWNAEVTCYDDREHRYDVSLIRDAVEGLLQGAGMAKKVEVPESVWSESLVPCSNCDGQGENEHIEWRTWRELHKRDWREALSGDDVPKCEEWTTCMLCCGTGKRLADSAEGFLELFEWAQKIVAAKKAQA